MNQLNIQAQIPIKLFINNYFRLKSNFVFGRYQARIPPAIAGFQ